MSIIGEVIQVGGGSPYTGQTTVTPTTSNVVLQTNKKFLKSDITVYGDSDLVAGNIKNGVNIFGVNGNVRPYGHITWGGSVSWDSLEFGAGGMYYTSKSGHGFTPIVSSLCAYNSSGSMVCGYRENFCWGAGMIDTRQFFDFWAGSYYSMTSSLIRVPVAWSDRTAIRGATVAANAGGYY